MEEKPEQTTQEMYGTVFHSCTHQTCTNMV